MKKFVCLLAFVLCFVMLFTACNNDTPSPSDTTTPDASQGSVTDPGSDGSDTSGSSENPVPTDNDGVIVSDGKTEYNVIRADQMEQTLVNCASELRTNIANGYNVQLSIKSDWVKGLGKDESIENNEREILVGHTNRKESRDVLATLKETQYVVKWVGYKLVIIGYDDYASATAVKAFMEKYVTGGDKLVFPVDEVMTGTASVQKVYLTKNADFRVMSYNLAGTTKEYSTRKAYIAESILYYLPDVIGFQECNATVHKDILSGSLISKYYAINARQHSNGSTYNYTPILYLKAKYNNVESGVTFLRSRYTGTNTKSISWAVLERKSDGQRFIVVNMHGSLWSTDYKLPAGETHDTMKAKAASEWKIDNAQEMVDKIAELQEKYGAIPAFTTGDYNFNMNHEAYKVTMQSTGLASSRDVAKTSDSGGSYHGEVGEKPPASGLPIDHIFFFPNLTDVFCYKIGTTQTDLNSTDHCPVYADFKLAK